MSGVVTDRDDPRLTHGVDATPVPQAEVYLVLSDEERAKGFVRPVRRTYRHEGLETPTHPLRDLTPEEAARYDGMDYVKYEEFPPGLSILGKFWTQAQLNLIHGGCGTVTTMGLELSETYARQPSFYGGTYCVGCKRHRPVAEFRWDADGKVVGS